MANTNQKKNPLSVSEAKIYIDSIDFSLIIDKMVRFDTWLQKDAEKTCQLYRNFLFMKKKYAENGVKVPPSRDVDEFWHYHILDTKKYHEDCNTIFGYYLDHHPTYLGKEGEEKLGLLRTSFKELQNIHFNEFGYFIETTRERRSKILNLLLCRLSRFLIKSSRRSVGRY